MFIIDFFRNRNYQSSAKLLADYFGINYGTVSSVLLNYNKDDYQLIDFIEKFNINLNHEFHDETYITCRHAMTTYDGLDYLKKYGLLNLKTMLDRKTPLSNFLNDNGISIDVDKKVIECNGIQHNIYNSKETCNACIFKEYQCTSIFNNNLPDYKNCEYRKKISSLYVKLYQHKCETEVFIDGVISDIYDYTSIRYAPEILQTIQDIVVYYDNTKGNLKEKWRHLPNNKFYIVEFNVDIKNFDLISTKKMYDSYWDIQEIAEKFGYDELDFEDDTITAVFYRNLFILKRLVDNFLNGSHSRYAQILPTTIIEGKNIKIIREHEVNHKVEEEER